MTDWRKYLNQPGVRYPPEGAPEYVIDTTPDPERKARDEAIRAKRRKRIEERKAGKCP